MDALSDILRIVRLKGGAFLHAEFTAPWCILSQIGPEDCGPLLDGAEHLVLYHYVVDGRLAARLPGEEPIEIGAGQVIIFPHNHAHLLGSDTALPPVQSQGIVRRDPATGLLAIRHGGGGTGTRVICGFLGCDRLHGDPLIAALPPVLSFDTEEGTASQWIRSSFEFAAQEMAARRAGSGSVLARVSELLFVEALRRYVEALPPGRTGWLGGLRDPFVARTLALIHSRLAEAWTVDSLGREVGLSRSALADRFTRIIGEPPMRYVQRWRIQVAAHRLRDSQLPLARIAEEVGYDSEAAFNRAFKRAVGEPPAAWRRRAREGARLGPAGAG